MIVATRRTVLGLPDFSPRQMHGLAVWLRSDQGVLSDGASQFTAANSESLSHADDATLNVTTSDFSLAVWVKTSAAAASGLIAKRDRSGNNPGYALEMAADGTVTVTICDGSGAPIVATSTSTVNDNAWHFIAAVADRDGNASLSIDGGAAQGATSISAQALTLLNTRTFYIGAGDSAGLERYLTGALALPALWKKLLTTDEITSLYNSGTGLAYGDLSGSLLTSLISYWNLDEPSGTRVDSHGDNDLTDNNTVTAAVGPNTHAATDGAAISQWTDQSGQAKNATQTTAANRPVFKAAIVNSRPVTRLDGSDDFLAASLGFAPAPFTVILVTTQRTYTAFPAFVSEYSGSSAGYLALGANTDATHQLAISRTGQATASSNLTQTQDVWDVVSYYSAVGVSAGAVDVEIRQNGVAASATVSLTSLSTNATINIGASKNGTADWLNGDIAEIIIYSRLLSAGERQRVERYLGRKYAVGVS